MPRSAIVPLDHLAEEPYFSVVCYPGASSAEMRSRMEELKFLKVEAIEFSGRSSAGAMSVLGKGHVGVVATAHAGGRRMALKMLRADSDYESLEHESDLLERANSVGVGPKLEAATDHFLLMQLIEGGPLEDVLAAHGDKPTVRKVLTDILEQCWRLDGIGLDHGELFRASKHIMVDGACVPFVVDFDSASVWRNASNVTSVCHFLFFGDNDARRTVEGIIGGRDRDGFVHALRTYRKNRTRRSFEDLLEQCFSDT